MWVTAVFAVVLLQAGDHPVYTIVSKVEATETRDAYAECRYQIQTLDVPDDKKALAGCMELVMHDDKGERVKEHVTYEHGRKMGNST